MLAAPAAPANDSAALRSAGDGARRVGQAGEDPTDGSGGPVEPAVLRMGGRAGVPVEYALRVEHKPHRHARIKVAVERARGGGFGVPRGEQRDPDSLRLCLPRVPRDRRGFRPADRSERVEGDEQGRLPTLRLGECAHGIAGRSGPPGGAECDKRSRRRDDKRYCVSAHVRPHLSAQCDSPRGSVPSPADRLAAPGEVAEWLKAAPC